MEKQMIIFNTIKIKAPATQVWDALVNPEKTKIYMFGCETVSDWKQGSELLWRAHYEGNDVDFVKGKIVIIEPGKKLVYTTFDPLSTMDDKPENYLRVTYELKENNGETELAVTQDGYDNAAEGERRFEEAWNNGEGWNPILVEIKKLVESMR